jgi:hypothetical protein
LGFESDTRKEVKVHLFGLPLNLHRRLKEESSNWQGAVPDGHFFRATPIYSNAVGPATDSELQELVVGVNDGFTHIVIPANRDWANIEKRLKFDCRVHSAKLRQPIRDLTWPILQENLLRITAMDEEWLVKVSPKDLRHALLLPPPVFATNAKTADYWRHCDAYSNERITAAERLLTEVEKEHRKQDSTGGRSWIDSRRRRYRYDPSRHALSPADRAQMKSYRFCYEIPSGFHYDMTDDSGREFQIEIGGKTLVLTHCNVTPWGVLRQG